MQLQLMNRFLILIILLFLNYNLSAQCFEITSIFVDACDNAPVDPEGANEMFTFEVGATAINVNNIVVFWPNNSFLGFCSSPAKTAALNATITNSCGYLLEPTANILPPNAKVIVISSTDFSTTLNSFNGLADTLYVLYQCAGNTSGHFANAGSGTRTLTMNVSGACTGTDAVTYDRALLFGGNGATVNFDAAGNANYVNNGCNAPVISYSLDWNIGNVCQTNGPINLNTLLSPGATLGGLWSGTGVTDSIFNPTGLYGPVTITYSLTGLGSCLGVIDSSITFNVDTLQTGSLLLQACDSVLFNGNYFTNDSIFTQSLFNASPFACDSNYIVTISISNAIIDSQYISVCAASYMYNGITYFSSRVQ